MSAPQPPSPRVDLNRGASMQRGPDDGWCCMYKDDPGVYFSDTMKPLSVEYAKAAGYDVEKQAKAAEFTRRKAEAEVKIRAELGLSDEAIRAEIDGDPIDEVILKADSKLVTERNAASVPRGTELHVMQHRGRGIWDVIDKVTNEPAIEACEEQYALDWMIRTAEEADGA